MLYFNCDYNEGAHPRIMERLMATNMEQTPGYGVDEYCQEAAESVKKLCQDETLDVHFLVGGTQANLTVISAALRSHQGVMAASTGHINVHETGAIESCGHKVLVIPSKDGKVTASQVQDMYKAHVEDETAEHMVQPKMVYISNPTELGTIYSREELEELHNTCSENGLILYMDGARLAYGLAAEDNTLDLPSIARYCDVFYIGGTKVGALFGEAVVIRNQMIQEDFRYLIKQKGGMLAKGRLLGLQFAELFKDGLYEEMGQHADMLADKIREACVQKGYPFVVENKTNQIFVILPDEKLEQLKEKYSYSYHERIDEKHSAVRFCTSWATKAEDVERLLNDL